MTPEIIITILVQFAGFAYLFGRQSSRIESLEKDVQTMAITVTRLADDFARHDGRHQGGL